MDPPFPSLTSPWHNAPYTAISPERPELNASAKTVIITGAGSGIGQATALAFDRAGASSIVLVGRKEETLKATQNSVHPASVTDEAALKGVAASIGPWDIMILAAGYISPKAHMQEASVDEWWQNFETNVKGTMIAANLNLRPEATSLNGSYVMANWDVNELKVQAEHIQSGSLLTSVVDGWPFSPR
ncbi:hypothetical protein N7454_008648 [Penicillium verhagenii]|nr:hypothetical protein N7454_008648 [Penicillium verhagenii]